MYDLVEACVQLSSSCLYDMTCTAKANGYVCETGLIILIKIKKIR